MGCVHRLGQSVLTYINFSKVPKFIESRSYHKGVFDEHKGFGVDQVNCLITSRFPKIIVAIIWPQIVNVLSIALCYLS
jgi:hypothetical protein